MTDPGQIGGPAPDAQPPAEGAAQPPGTGQPGTGQPTAGAEAAAGAAAAPRPLIERIGLFLIAVVLAALFGGIALALVAGGELFLGAMAAIGCAMTVWVGGLTLLRG